MSANLAAADIVSMSHQLYYVVAAVAGVAFIAGGIIKALHKQHKIGTGAAIAAFIGGLVLSIMVGSAISLRDIGANELEKRTGIHQQSGYYGQ
jgi:membrane associated rhomboid family serine protease